MTDELREQLAAAGYTPAQIAKEEAYLARVAAENADIRQRRECNYGFHHAGEEA